MTVYTCPKGHEVTCDERDIPECEECDIIATAYNPRLGEVFTWTPREEHAENCRNLQADMDAAFDNTYFSDGW